MHPLAFSLQDFQKAPRQYTERLVESLKNLHLREQSAYISQWTEYVWPLDCAVAEYAMCIGEYLEGHLFNRMGITWAQWIKGLPMGEELKQLYNDAKTKYDRKTARLGRLLEQWGEPARKDTYVTQASIAILGDLAQLAEAGYSYDTVKTHMNAAVYARLRDECRASETGKRFGSYMTSNIMATKRDFDRFCRRSRGRISIPETLEVLSDLELRSGIPGRPLRIGSCGLIEDDSEHVGIPSTRWCSISDPNIGRNANTNRNDQIQEKASHKQPSNTLQGRGFRKSIALATSAKAPSGSLPMTPPGQHLQQTASTPNAPTNTALLSPLRRSGRRSDPRPASWQPLPTPESTPKSNQRQQKSIAVKSFMKRGFREPVAVTTPSIKRHRQNNNNDENDKDADETAEENDGDQTNEDDAESDQVEAIGEDDNSEDDSFASPPASSATSGIVESLVSENAALDPSSRPLSSPILMIPTCLPTSDRTSNSDAEEHTRLLSPVSTEQEAANVDDVRHSRITSPRVSPDSESFLAQGNNLQVKLLYDIRETSSALSKIAESTMNSLSVYRQEIDKALDGEASFDSIKDLFKKYMAHLENLQANSSRMSESLD